jgi:hypothetical protein
MANVKSHRVLTLHNGSRLGTVMTEESGPLNHPLLFPFLITSLNSPFIKTMKFNNLLLDDIKVIFKKELMELTLELHCYLPLLYILLLLGSYS